MVWLLGYRATVAQVGSPAATFGSLAIPAQWRRAARFDGHRWPHFLHLVRFLGKPPLCFFFSSAFRRPRSLRITSSGIVLGSML